jgi:hypothetical protein
MEFGLDPTVPHTVHLQFKSKTSTVNNHLKRKVEIVKLDAARCCQPSEQAPWHSTQVCRQRAHVDELAPVRDWWFIRFACDQVIRHNE